MTKLTQEQAAKAISEKVAAAYTLINEAEALADEHGLDFSFDVAYGMGGTYYGETSPEVGRWTEAGWNPSSHSC